MIKYLSILILLLNACTFLEKKDWACDYQAVGFGICFELNDIVDQDICEYIYEEAQKESSHPLPKYVVSSKQECEETPHSCDISVDSFWGKAYHYGFFAEERALKCTFENNGLDSTKTP
ncbi:MAG: hypothetical protein OCD76_06630 [Reichenbachiella sp.]